MKTPQKRMNHAYLYQDGHAAIVWEKYDPDAGHITWVELHEEWTRATLAFKGRVRFGAAELARMAKRATRIEPSLPAVSNGSEKTKALQIRVSFLSFEFGQSDHFTLSAMPDLTFEPWGYQPDIEETWQEVSRVGTWGSHPISKFHPKPSKPALSAAA